MVSYNKSLMLLLLSIFFTAINAFAESVEVIMAGVPQSDCHNMDIETKTIIGKYGGWSGNKVMSIAIEVEGSRQPIHMAANKNDANKFFGDAKGKLFSVTYKVKQGWWDADKFCSQYKVFISAKPVGNTKKQN